MINAIFYKEWIKTKWYYAVACLLLIGFASYAGIYLKRVGDLSGMAALWEYYLSKDDSLITIIKYLPLIVGIGGAVFQFAPEMHRKCLKLTLHLPCGYIKSVGAMMLFGTGILVMCSLICFAVLYVFASHILPNEIVSRILLTAIPWFLAGFCAYYLTIWVVVEPVWKKRVFQTILSVVVLKLFIITDTPGAYLPSLWWLVPLAFGAALLPVISLSDFKEGLQD